MQENFMEDNFATVRMGLWGGLAKDSAPPDWGQVLNREFRVGAATSAPDGNSQFKA
jgi:hypothetical protein